MGFALAGFYFGTFSHVFNHSGAIGNQNAPYGVYYLGEYATYAGLLPNLNFTNTTAGPCQNVTANGTNQLNNSSVRAGVPLNLTAANATNSINGSTTYVCLNAVFNGNISYIWDFVNGSFLGYLANYTAWNNIGVSVNNTSVMGANNDNTTFNESLFNLTGDLNLSNDWLNMTGCNPGFNNTSFLVNHTPQNCRYFAGNLNTTFLPHSGFWTSSGKWINETTATGPDPAWWHPNQTGYLPSDMVYQASVMFANFTPANTTYEIAMYMGGATPIPQVFFVNTGAGGQNETVTFLFDMSLAWTTAFPGNYYGYTNTTMDGFFAGIIAEISQVSMIVYQCYVDASGNTACPMTTAPLFGSLLG